MVERKAAAEIKESSELANSRRLILDAVQDVRSEVQIDNLALWEITDPISKYASVNETMPTIEELFASDTLPVVGVTGGLTRSGKTISSTLLVKTIDKLGGLGVFCNLEGRDNKDVDTMLRSICTDIDRQIRRKGDKDPNLIVIDELGVLRKRYSTDEICGIIDTLVKKYPNSLFLLIDVYFRNRGKISDTDVGKTPNIIQNPIVFGLRERNIRAEKALFRDAWRLSTVEKVLAAFADRDTQPLLLKETAKELLAFTMSNPFIVKQIINTLLYEDGDNKFLSAVKVKELHKRLRAINAALLALPDLNDVPLKIYRDAGLKDIAQYFEDAFGGYSHDIMRSKAHYAALSHSLEADGDIDLSIYGRH